MPKATVSTEAEKFELKSAPPDGYIVVQRMSYGAMLQRQQIAMNVMVEADRKKKGGDTKAEMKFAQSEVFLYEMQCVIDHNLEDEAGRKLNLRSAADLARLDPRVGSEINDIIQELHQFEEDLEGNSSATPVPSS